MTCEGQSVSHPQIRRKRFVSVESEKEEICKRSGKGGVPQSSAGEGVVNIPIDFEEKLA